MLTPPVDVTESALRDALASGWELAVSTSGYLPVGFGGHHWEVTDDQARRWFVTVDDLRTKAWLGQDLNQVEQGLAAAYSAARVAADAGVPSLAPVASIDGSAVRRLGPWHVISLTPWSDGVGAVYSRVWPEEHRAAALEAVARLHCVATSEVRVDRIEPFVERPLLLSHLGALTQPWDGGPHADRARQWLAARADAVEGLLVRFDALVPHLADRPVVVTHGEPRRDNLLVRNGTVALVDWDTCGLAPPERDLWWFGDITFEVWSRATGLEPSSTGLECYNLAWTLGDIASLVGDLRMRHEDTEDTSAVWGILSDFDLGVGR